MLYSKYEIIYYFKQGSLQAPVREYISAFSRKEQAKLMAYIEFLGQHQGKLFEPYAKHIHEKIWELRVRVGKHHHRIFYFIAPEKKIVLLSAFLKHSQKTPPFEITHAYQNCTDYMNRL